MRRLLACLWVCGVMSGCGDSSGGALSQGRLELRAGQSVAGTQECGVNLPACPSHFSCMSFKLDGVTQVRCLDDSKVCSELMKCTGGTQCVILDSYPGQVACSGRCTNDCDTSVSSPAP